MLRLPWTPFGAQVLVLHRRRLAIEVRLRQMGVDAATARVMSHTLTARGR